MRARERILDAATAMVERSGFEVVNIAAVAAEAGVSRQTVYAHFGSREDLLSHAVTRVVGDVMAEVDASISRTADALEYAVELMVAVRQQFRRHAVLGALLFPDGGNPLFDDDLLARAHPASAELLKPLVERRPELADRYDDIVELLVRIGVSILLFDSAAIRTDDDLRAFLRRTLTPFLAG